MATVAMAAFSMALRSQIQFHHPFPMVLHSPRTQTSIHLKHREKSITVQLFKSFRTQFPKRNCSITDYW
jgi:hypothetical protein